MEVVHCGDEFCEDALHDVAGEGVAVVACYVEEVTTRTVRQYNKCLGIIVVEGLQVHEGRMRDRSEHLHFSLEAELHAFFVGAARRTVLDDFDGHKFAGI